MHSGFGPKYFIQNGTPFAAISVMVQRSALPVMGFDQRLKTASDWKLWIDCLVGGGAYGFLDHIYARYRRSETNVSNNIQNMVTDRLVTIAIIESTYPEFIHVCKKQRARAYYDFGINLMKEGNSVPARRALAAAARSSQVSLRILAALLFSYLPGSLKPFFFRNRFAPRRLSDIILNLLHHADSTTAVSQGERSIDPRRKV